MLEDVPEPGGRSAVLPVALSILVGRTREIAALSEMLGRHRMVTVLGTGGVGKTRLTLALAESLESLGLGTPRWVELAAVPAGEDLLVPVVAKALGVAQTMAEGSVATISARLRAEPSVLVLDNCEQVAQECAELIERVLRDCPNLRVLATSREVLGVPGEHIFEVAGLELPVRGEQPLRSDAVLLFCNRASALAPRWEPTAVELEMIAALCTKLDGLPLAIELAASVAAVLGVAEVSSHLDEDAGLLRHPSRSAPQRHRTLEATLDWSYGLLTPAEKDLLKTVACFKGTFSLLAAQAVASGASAVDARRPDVALTLASLVGKCLLVVAERGPEHRYRMLGTVRQQVLAKLLRAPEAARVLRSHSRFYLELAKQAEAGLEGRDQDRWLERLELEHDNMRAVLERELVGAPGPDAAGGREAVACPEVGGDMAGSLRAFWYRRGYYDEARHWLERAAQLSDHMSPAVRAKVLRGAGVLAFLQCDYQMAESRLEQARSLNEQLGDKAAIARAVQRLGSVQRERGNYEQATQLHRESLRLWSELGEAGGVASSQDYLGFVAWLEGRYEDAEQLCSKAFSYFEQTGRRQESIAALVNLGASALHAGDSDKARARLEPALKLARSIGYQEGTAWSLHLLGVIAGQGRLPEAGPLLRESLEIHMELGDRWRVSSVLESVAACWAGGPSEEAAMLLAAACCLRQAIGTPVPPAERPEVDRAISRVKASLGEDRFEACWASGLAMSLPAAVELARNFVEAMTSAPSGAVGAEPSGGLGSLTEREVAVLRLIAGGLSNKEIGRELFISPGTAGVQPPIRRVGYLRFWKRLLSDASPDERHRPEQRSHEGRGRGCLATASCGGGRCRSRR
jgi:predicted ATPase